ncbi:MAG: hypothetical protein HRT35_09495 [Algicola sp.]|nr:hypothetical protein [Algicola sp.]
MNLRATLVTASLVFASTVVTTTFAPDVAAQDNQKTWHVSPKKGSKVNPIPATKQSVRRGHVVFVFNACDQCHGPDGFAPNASNAPDLNSAEIWNQTDGAIFSKIKSRRHSMPGARKMRKADVWHLTNFLRSEYDVEFDDENENDDD